MTNCDHRGIPCEHGGGLVGRVLGGFPRALRTHPLGGPTLVYCLGPLLGRGTLLGAFARAIAGRVSCWPSTHRRLVRTVLPPAARIRLRGCFPRVGLRAATA